MIRRSVLILAAVVLVGGLYGITAHEGTWKGNTAEKDNNVEKKELQAVVDFLKSKGVELRSTKNRSNVIAHMFTVGPDHDKRHQVGLNYLPQTMTSAEVQAKYTIAIPYVVQGHWILWQVGGPGGNATKEYLASWEKVLAAFKEYRGAVKSETKEYVHLMLKETAGIRRFGYPCEAQVPFPKGALRSAQHARLLHSDTEIVAQYGVESTWDDGSVKWLAIDFNINMAPMATENFQVEYGDQVAPTVRPRGLTVTETTEAIQVGPMRFRKDGRPLIESCIYGDERIGQGRNGIVVTDTTGRTHDFSEAHGVTMKVIKPGPLRVRLRGEGLFPLGDGAPATFVITIEMPNSKSWWKMTYTIHDPQQRVKAVALDTPFALGVLPWTWDFGTGRWTYGALRQPNQSVVLTQSAGAASATQWIIGLGDRDRELPYEVSGDHHSKMADGWGHIQDTRNAVAFAMDHFGRQAGTYQIALDGRGQSSFHFAPAPALTQTTLVVYQHFINVPVHIGAATSPPSMLTPLVAVCEKAYYARCGVPVPKEVTR